jgi:hypothetical protein
MFADGLQDAARQPETVRYRLTVAQLLPMIGVFFLAFLPGTLLALLPHRTPSPGYPAPGLALRLMPLLGPVAFSVEMFVLSRWCGLTLTQDAAIVRRIGRRTIRWADVSGVEVERRMGTTTVVLYESGGRRTRLRAPITGFLQKDKSFPAKAETIRTWWLQHGLSPGKWCTADLH